MNASELAGKMLEWEKAQTYADTLRAEIEAAVLEVGKTQRVGNVVASYSGGRTTYDYRAAAYTHPMLHDIPTGAFTKVTTTIDWRGICDHLKIDKAVIPFTKSEPSVTVKLEKSND